MINYLTHAPIYTQQTTIQEPMIKQRSNTARLDTQDNHSTNKISSSPTFTLSERGQAAVQSDTQSNPYTSATSELLTNKGRMNIDLDNYFSNTPSSTGFLDQNNLPPLLLPSVQNVNAISEHASTRFKQLLEDYNIPSAPEKITFDNEGKMQIPIKYPYANELNHALEENTGMARELRSLHAISSHAAEIQERMPFIEEMNNASSKAETDSIIAKYSHLLYDNNSYKSIALLFSSEGDVSVTANGEPIKYT